MNLPTERRIDFFIVGTQKGGTTALSRKLALHPKLCCSRKKELHFFDNDALDWTQAAPFDPNPHFAHATPGQLWGEATPITMYWPGAIERLARYNPEARIIVTLRHPAYRALSQWKMETLRKAETLRFDEVISANGRSRVGSAHRVYSYVERGFYANQIARILSYFPARNVFFMRMEDLLTDEAGLLTALADFLGVEPLEYPTGPHYVVPIDTSDIMVEVTAELAILQELYRADMIETAQLTGLDLRSWLAGTYSETQLTAIRDCSQRQ